MKYTFTLNISTILQALTWAAAILAELLSANLIPEKYKHAAFVAAGILSLVLHRKAGNVNPNGAPAALPFVPPNRPIDSATAAAYEAYRAQIGDRLPDFAVLPAAEKDAFHAAVLAAEAHREQMP